MTHDKTIVLNVSVLRALAKHVASVDDERLWKTGVQVSPHAEGLIYTASDGWFVVRWLDKDDLFPHETKLQKPIVFLAADLQRLDLAAKNDPFMQPAYEVDERLWRVGGVVASVLAVDYPDVSKTIPRTLDRSEGQYKFSYFAQCHKVASEASRRAKSSVSLYVCQNGVSGGALVSSPGCENFMAVIMPTQPAPMFDAAPHWAFHFDAPEAGNKSSIDVVA